MNKLIQVFEHSKLLIGTNGFTHAYWEAMAWFNNKNEGRYFTLLPNGVKFNQFVGVIQVGNLTVEILPKISKVEREEDKLKWQKVLIDMLNECKCLTIYDQDKANLQKRPNSILDAYLTKFIYECEKIVRLGLVKNYRTIRSNSSALKGRLIFSKQIQKNIVHKELFYTQHQVYDKDNILNQILIKTIKLVLKLTENPLLKDRIYGLLLEFPELSDVNISKGVFEKIVYSRKTESYREPIAIAEMLLLNYRPDISHGKNHILSILFDMNSLWEEYVYRQIIKFSKVEWRVEPQNIRDFWKSDTNDVKTIRPDIVIFDGLRKVKYILDTKWKVPDSNKPDDSDLKQMFVYNEYWNSEYSFLVYPNAKFSEMPFFSNGVYFERKLNTKLNSCGMLKLSVLDKSNVCLDGKFGKKITDFLFQLK